MLAPAAVSNHGACEAHGKTCGGMFDAPIAVAIAMQLRLGGAAVVCDAVARWSGPSTRGTDRRADPSPA